MADDKDIADLKKRMKDFGGLLESVVSSGRKSVNQGEIHRRIAMQAEIEAREKLIQSMKKLYNVNDEEANKKVNQYLQEEQEHAEQLNKEQQREKTKEKWAAAGINGTRAALSAVSQFASSALAAMSAEYSAANAFQAAIPALDLLKTSVTSIVHVLAEFAEAIPYVGKALGALDMAFGAAAEIITAYAKMEIERAEKVSGMFNEVVKTGFSFGGNIDAFAETAHRAGLDLQTYEKFASKSRESLIEFGGGLDHASVVVARLAKGELNANSQLMRLYGGVEGLLDATAQMAPIIGGLGLGYKETMTLLETGAMPFLATLKTITNLTGKQIEQIKKEEEERRSNALYLIQSRELERKNPAAYRNLQLILATLPEDLKKYAVESFSRGGEVFTRENQIFRAFNEDAAAIVDKLRSEFVLGTSAGENEITSRERLLKTIKGMDEILSTAVENNQDLVQVQGLTNNEVVEKQSALKAQLATLANTFGQLEKGGSLQEMIDRSKLGIGKNSLELSELEIGLMKKRIGLDNEIISSFGEVANMAKALARFTDSVKEFVESFGGGSAAINWAAEKMTKMFDTLSRYLGPDGKGEMWKDMKKGMADAAESVQDIQRDAWNWIKQAFLGLVDDIREGWPTALGGAKGRMFTDKEGNLLPDYKDSKGDIPAETQDRNDIKRMWNLLDYMNTNVNMEQLGFKRILGTPILPEAIAGGRSRDDLNAFVASLVTNPNLKGTMITAMNDLWHHKESNVKNPALDPHVQGRAADLVLPASMQGKGESIAALINQLMQEEGIKGTANFEHKGEKGATGDHVHVEFAKDYAEHSAATQEELVKQTTAMNRMNANLEKLLHAN